VPIFLLVLSVGCAGCSQSREPPHNGTNVLLIIMDTVRADRLSCYGNRRKVTPMIDAIAHRGVLFENFYSNSSWTLPAHASLFTGVYAAAHRATQEKLELDDRFPTLAGILDEAGYQTFGSSTNGIVSGATGLDRGLDTFVPAFSDSIREALIVAGIGHLDPNNIAFERFLKTSHRDRPFFVFLNYIDPHAPYEPPKVDMFVDKKYSRDEIAKATRVRMTDHYMHGTIDDEQFELLNQLYEAEINQVDRAVDNLYATLQADGRLNNTLIIITSDHGENLGEHGHFAHVFSIHNTLLKIPLIVMPPGGMPAGSVRHDTAQLLDLFPTVLEWCGVEYEGSRVGRDLFAEGAETASTYAMAEYYYPRQVLAVFDPEELLANGEKFHPFMKRLRALQNGEYKLTWGSDGSRGLFRIDKDPGETVDLLARNPFHPAVEDMVARLERMVAEYQGDPPLDPPPPAGPDTRQRRGTTVLLFDPLSTKCDHNAPATAPVTVFAQVDALPGAEVQAPGGDRHRHTASKQRRLDVRRHVVGALGGVDVVGRVFRHHLVEV
jgi:arylsulfatase A-like enzyme